jgi:hypothetical protein
LPLLEKVRIELFIPDLPDPIYGRLVDELGDELSYPFGGCTVISTQGKYRSTAGFILPDKINILFTDTPFYRASRSEIFPPHCRRIWNLAASWRAPQLISEINAHNPCVRSYLSD